MKANKILSAGVLSSLLVCGAAVFGQNQSTVVVDQPNQIPTVARGNNLYCAGYIQNQPVNSNIEIVGGEQEQEQRVYSDRNLIYINAGAQQGIKEDDRFIVTRPRGGFRSPFSDKGRLGIFTQEVGIVRVMTVKPQISIVQVENACETILLGDLLVPFQVRTAPDAVERPAFDRFRDSSGKATGRIVLARDGRETVSRDQIVYLDLGAEDNVKSGDYLTIFRPLGDGSITKRNQTETAKPTDYGFESKEFRGGKFSNQAPRQKGVNADGGIVTTPNAKTRRPSGLRKIVGEVVIINVQQRTATAVITRTAQEIHTGDYVELQ